MSRSTNGKRNRGFEPEWNSRRPMAPNCGCGGGNPNGDSWAKKVSHHIERQQERALIREEIKELDDQSQLPEQEYYTLGDYLGRQWLIILGGAGA